MTWQVLLVSCHPHPEVAPSSIILGRTAQVGPMGKALSSISRLDYNTCGGSWEPVFVFCFQLGFHSGLTMS